MRAGLLCGVLAPLLWAAAIIAAGEMRPGFDHVAQYISELGERGSPNADLMRYGGFVATGMLTEPQLALVHQKLTEAYVALDAVGLATASCAEWRKRDPAARLDPALHSPKIVAACEHAEP